VTAAIYHALERELPVAAVIVQAPVPRGEILRRRAKLFGWASALGQALFSVTLRAPVHRAAAERIMQIANDAGLDTTPPPAHLVHQVPTVNGPECRALLRRFSPGVVIVNGTRIIGKKTLRCVDAPFVNIHCGITPGYRGIHGGYWALVDGHPEQCGVTVHLVDEGIDTGGVVGQALIAPTAQDNLASYLWLQIAAGIPLLVGAARDALAGTLRTVPELHPAAPSRLWSGPTLLGYLWTRLARGVK
jgi:methionyl-tRNA formyltransferase